MKKKDLDESELESEIEETEYDSHEKITKRLIPVLKTNKNKQKYNIESEDEDDIDELSNYKVYIDSRSEARDESKMDIYKNLNIELFKENSNKSRNQFIKNIWKDFNSKEFTLPDEKNIIITKIYVNKELYSGFNGSSIVIIYI